MSLHFFVLSQLVMQGLFSSLVDKVMKVTLMNLHHCILRTLSLWENLSSTWVLIYYNFPVMKKQEKFMERDWISWLGFWILKIVLMESTCVLLPSVFLALESYNLLCTL